MADLTRIDAAQAVELTDGSSLSAALSSSAPAGTEVGLITRNIPSGTYTVAGTTTAVPSGTYTVAGTTTAVPSGTYTVAGSGTFTVADNQVVADNAGFTDGTTKVFAAGFIYDEVAGTALTENDAAAGRINANRALVNVIEDGSTRGRYATVSAANALKVDGSSVTQPVSGTFTSAAATSGTATLSNVSASESSVTLLSLNSSRLMAMIFNDGGTVLYLKLGTTASTSSFTVKMTPGSYYELPTPTYTGRIDGIWAATASGAARVTEMT